MSGSFALFEAAKVPSKDLYRLMVSCIVPRPIALVSTLNQDGKSVNVAPFSFFNGCSSNPPTLCISFTNPPPGKDAKDSLRNIQERKEFVVNASQVPYASAINACSKDLPYGESELSLAPEFSLLPSHEVRVPRVAQAAWSMECVLHDSLQIGERHATGSATLVVGRILCIHVNKDYLNASNTALDAVKLHPLARLGGTDYCGIATPFSLSRPKQ